MLLLTEHIKEGVTVHGWYGWYNLKLASGEEKRKIKIRDNSWKQARCFCLSRNRTEHMLCEFNKRHMDPRLAMKIGEHIITTQVLVFKYFGFIIQNDKEIEGDEIIGSK